MQPGLTELLILLVCTLMAMASPVPGNVMATEPAPPQATQRGGHSAMITAGSKILRDIAMRRLAETMGMPTNATFLNGEESEIQEAISLMCQLWDLNKSIQDFTAKEETVSYTLLKKLVVKIIQPTCDWVKILLSNGSISNTLVCSREEINNVCSDYQTFRFSSRLVATSSNISTSHVTKSEWVGDNIQTRSICPDVFQQIILGN